ncbi:phosphoribosylanthranilate isomerase [Bacillus sp. DJP31]|uniref:phosphoribosylanthranilate isomerase n=1 Tax=Bacillus sp. DJP31 TaxID=3409789 RepID=UPI003BB594B8
MKRPLFKYCGNRNFEDWCHVIGSKADFIGVIFAPSKRRVTPHQVLEWSKKKPLPIGKKLIGVFVHSPIAEILEAVNTVPISIVQCHGHETPGEIFQLKEKVDLPIWKAIHHEENAIEKMKSYYGIVDGYVVDTKSTTAYGGTGIPFNWSAIPNYLEEANKQGVPCFIAGGVSPGNVSQLVDYLPDGIDLASGIEIEEGKSSELINKLEIEVDRHVNNKS